MPVACMCAWQTVGPTNLKPRCFKSFDRALDSGEVAFMVFLVSPFGLRKVRLCVNCQIYRSKLPNSFCTARKQRALVTAALIFIEFRMMPASLIKRATSDFPYPATLRGSKLLNAFRKFSRLRKIVIQLSPAWKPSRISISNILRSS